MNYLKSIALNNLKPNYPIKWCVALIHCFIFTMAGHACAVNNETDTSTNVETVTPVSRGLEQIRKDEANYSPPTRTQEIPFRPTVNEETYRKAKEKAWRDRYKSHQRGSE